MKILSFPLFFFYLVIASFPLRGGEPSWKNSLSPEKAGNFPEIPPFHASYEFGWMNIGAGKAQVTFYYAGDRYFFSASGGTYGWARNLWQLDATQVSAGSRISWLPEMMHQIERYRPYTMIMDVHYSALQADRLRMAIPEPDKPPARKIFAIKNLRDMVAAMLFVRSQPLRDGEEISQVVFPGDSAFLVKTKVLGRETIDYKGKPIPAIKFSLSMKKILMEGPQKGNLVPSSKFNSGVVWISDDARRIPLRTEMDIFVGYVYAQLRSLE